MEAVLEADKKAIEEEYHDILHLIHKTPYASREEVEKYHSSIKQRLDSGKIIPVPSWEHRALHVMMWVAGCEVYDGVSVDEAINRKFCKVEEVNGGVHSKLEFQGARFVIWYAQNYLKGELNDWGRIEVEDAERAARKFFGKSLDEVVIDLG